MLPSGKKLQIPEWRNKAFQGANMMRKMKYPYFFEDLIQLSTPRTSTQTTQNWTMATMIGIDHDCYLVMLSAKLEHLIPLPLPKDPLKPKDHLKSLMDD